MEMHEAVIRVFLEECPEQIQGTKRMPADHPTAPGELMLDTDTLIAFADWTIRTGRGDAAKAGRFREQLRERFGR